MNYKATLHYLYSRLPMFTRVGAAAYKPDLTNTLLLCEQLDHPQHKFKSIHIAGTNGKGSCSHMLASVFQTSGYKTGLYTSPHIRDFRERIKINGIEIEEARVVDFVRKFQHHIEQINPSFFELTVAMAFDFFASQKVDIAIIEVGLGGLLDSTNVIIPELSIITNISYDHANLLGNTIEEIAKQKAGIIKTHVPVVIGETDPQTASIFKAIATKQQSQIYFADQSIETLECSLQPQGLSLELFDQYEKKTIYVNLDLNGLYQEKNCKSVLMALNILRSKGWKVSNQDTIEALSNVKKNTGLKGRFDYLMNAPMLITDVAHNEAGVEEVLRHIHQIQIEQLHIVCGFVKDKEIDHILQLFPMTARYYFTQAQIPRALDYKELQQKASDLGLKGESYPTVQDALNSALNNANKNDLILVTGSFFILDEVYTMIEEKFQSKI